MMFGTLPAACRRGIAGNAHHLAYGKPKLEVSGARCFGKQSVLAAERVLAKQNASDN